MTTDKNGNKGFVLTLLAREQYIRRERATSNISAGGMTEGMAGDIAAKTLSKFRPDGLIIVRAGGAAGKFSAIIGGWAASGVKGSIPVSKEIMS